MHLQIAKLRVSEKSEKRNRGDAQQTRLQQLPTRRDRRIIVNINFIDNVTNINRLTYRLQDDAIDEAADPTFPSLSLSLCR